MDAMVTLGKTWLAGFKKSTNPGVGSLMFNVMLMDAQKLSKVGAPTPTIGNTTSSFTKVKCQKPHLVSKMLDGIATCKAVTDTLGKKWVAGSKRSMSLGVGLLMSNATLMDAQKPLRAGEPTLTVGTITLTISQINRYLSSKITK
jgi:hypothetical protein